MFNISAFPSAYLLTQGHCAPIILAPLIFKEKTVAVIEAKAECIVSMASLINIGKHKKTVRITNRGPRKEGSHLNHDGHSKVT